MFVFQARQPLIMQPLQLRHGECSAKVGSASQLHYFSKKVSSCLRTLTIIPSEMSAAVFSAIELESTKMGLAIYEGKTKYRVIDK